MTVPRDKRVLTGAFLCLYLVLLYLQGVETLQRERGFSSDARDYVTTAWNVVHHGTFSLSLERPDKAPWPSMRRAPAYPLMLALGIWASPDLRTLELEAFFKDESQARLRPLRWLQFLLLQATALLAMWLAWELTRNLLLALLSLGLAGLDNELIAMSWNLLSEGLACFLLTSLSLCLALTVKTRRRRLFGLSGLTLAALALTRPAYSYLALVMVLFFCLLVLRQPAERKRSRAGILIFLICFAAPVGAWMGRNLLHFQRARIANGAGVVLDIRSRLDLMTARQYQAAFLYWSSSSYLRGILSRRFDKQTVAFLDERSPEGAYRQAYERTGTLTLEHGGTDADSVQQNEAIARILSHPWRHFAVTLPVALRGIYVHGIVFSVLLFACLLGGFVMVCLRRDALCIAALLPAAFSFGFHSIATQNMSRFSLPLLAILWVSLVLMLSELDASRRVRPGPAPIAE